MAERKSLDGLTLTRQRGMTLMALGAMEIWDGADLSLLRDGLNHVIGQCGSRSIAVDMSAVKYVPSGFFGMLFDWYDQGVTIRLLAPQERVRNMLWFRQFFRHDADRWYLLHDKVRSSERESAQSDAWEEAKWDSAVDEATPVTADR